MRRSSRRRWIANKQHRARTTSRDGAAIAFYEHGSGDKTLFLVNPVLYGLATHFASGSGRT